MNATQLQLLESHLCSTPGSEPVEPYEPLLVLIREMAIRDWAVRVLDAWALDRDEDKPPAPERFEDDYQFNPVTFKVVVPAHALAGLDEQGGDRYCDSRDHFAESADAARLAAAEAVWPELPESVRSQLGAKP